MKQLGFLSDRSLLQARICRAVTVGSEGKGRAAWEEQESREGGTHVSPRTRPLSNPICEKTKAHHSL